MSPIVEYLDYRKYILDYYTECKATSGFTWRAFAAKAGFSSPIYLKQVTEGKCNLSSAAAERVGKAMDLAGLDLTYFRQLVAFNHAKVDAERIHAFKIMQNIAKSSKAKFLGGDDFAYFQSWKAPVIREISEAMPGASAEEMAKECLPHITPGEVNNTMQLLLRLGLLVQDKDGRYHQTSNVISMADGELKKIAASKMQQEMGEFALDALQNLPLEERSMSGLTMRISKDTYKELVKEIANFRKKVIAIASADKAEDQVYRLNLQLFPLTKKLKGQK